jgi:hypothetical protein
MNGSIASTLGCVAFLGILALPPLVRADDDDLVTDKHRQFWAFRPPQRPAVPRVTSARARTDVDAFLLAPLAERGLTFSADADRYALIRRATFDLTGLPPTPEEITAFVEDRRADAYERLIDRLLASPHFGEHWGRHWLDAAGYSDIHGCDNDAARLKIGVGMWRYRDYAIRSFNADKAFDRFLTEQIAGDELMDRSAKHYTAEMKELLIATGFLRVASDDTDENELNTLDIRHGVLDRTVETLASNLLGITLNCAKCHDHKFDPIPQEDYYRLTALLAPAFNPDRWVQPQQRQLGDLAPAEKAELTRQAAGCRKDVADLARPHETKLFADRLAQVPAELRDDVKAAVQTPAAKRNEVQKYLAGKYEARLTIRPEDALPVMNEAERNRAQTALKRLHELEGVLKGEGTIQAVYDVGAPTPTRLLKRGDYLRPGAEVSPGYLRVLCRSRDEAVAKVTPPRGETSGRRLALVRWLTTPNTPAAGLVARVQVNRVWQRLFGTGIVPTTENLGPSGMRPTHPELLDWLASDFIRNGWHFKPLLKQLMTSTAYRQASAVADSKPSNPPSATRNPQSEDPDNKLLWRMRLRRLDAENVRDALLTVSGKLDRELGGAPLPLLNRPDGLVVVDDKQVRPSASNRRSVYILARRNYHLSLLNIFDQPVMSTNCTCRESSAVVGQSLTMLNDTFVLEQARHLAERVGAGSPQDQIGRACRIALTRQPRPDEVTLCSEFLQKQAARYQASKVPAEQAARLALEQLCHALLNTSEFLYVP